MTADCSLAACSEVHSGFCLKPCRCRMSEKNDSNHANNAICDWKVSDESRKTVANCALARNSAGGFTISAPSFLSCFVSLWTIRSGGAAFQRRRISRSSPSIIFYLRILACDGLPSRDDYYLSNSFLPLIELFCGVTFAAKRGLRSLTAPLLWKCLAHFWRVIKWAERSRPYRDTWWRRSLSFPA